MMSRIALVRTSAVLLGGPWAAAWLPRWSLGGSVAAAGGVQRYYAHVALPEDLVSIRAAETTYRYMRTPSQAVTRVRSRRSGRGLQRSWTTTAAGARSNRSEV